MINRRLDSLPLDKTYYTEEGYLVDHPIVTTCGIFEYKNSDGTTRRELRLPEYVFEEKSLESYKGKPIIITHDAGEVDKNNVREEQIGTIMSKGYRDGDNVRCEIIIHDTDALKKCGLKELSLGYSLDTDETPGIWKGEKYDCVQKNIEINHLALVGEARAGETARLNIDSKENDIKILKGGKLSMDKTGMAGYRTDENDLTPEELEAAIELFKAQKAAVSVSREGTDGEDDEPKSTENTEGNGAEAKSPIEQVRENVDRRDNEGEEMDPKAIIAEQKADIDTLLKEIDKLQASQDMETIGDSEETEENGDSEETEDNSDNNEEEEKKSTNMDSIDKRFQERLDICRMADKLNLDGVENLSITEGRKRVVKAVNPKMNLDGKSEVYIKAAYDIAKDTFKSRRDTDMQRQRMAATKARRDAAEKPHSITARAAMIKRMTGGKR